MTCEKKKKIQQQQQDNNNQKHGKVCTRFFWFPSCQIKLGQMDEYVQRCIPDFCIIIKLMTVSNCADKIVLVV